MEKNNKQNKNLLPLIVLLLDGWGIDKENKGNAIRLADTPYLDSYKKYTYSKLYAHGKYVGLPPHQIGNSEAGHMNIGAGRRVEQDVVKISKSINNGTFFKNAAFLEAIHHVKNNNSNLHLMGILSNGMSPHSDPDHILALLETAKQNGIKNVYLHLFTDGRDSPQYASLQLIQRFSQIFKNGEKIATVMGRFYAMDRKKKWSRTKKAYEALTQAKGILIASASDAITSSYNSGLTDEYIKPYIITKNNKPLPRISDNDSVIFFNLRSDRARQLSKVFVQEKFNKSNPNSFKRNKVLKNIVFATMTDFGPDLDDILAAYPSEDLVNTLPMVLKDISQLYISEAEKYAHVTYFFNGGYDHKVDSEDTFFVPSPDVISYDQTPAMKAEELTKKILKNLSEKKYDFTFLNFAAPDMVGHTGNLKAAIKCCEEMDKYVNIITENYLKNNGTVLILGDHGNIEKMIHLETDEINTEHTTNKVPFYIINKKFKDTIKLADEGSLSDVAPTILDLLNIKKPKEMTGKSLVTNPNVLKKLS